MYPIIPPFLKMWIWLSQCFRFKLSPNIAQRLMLEFDTSNSGSKALQKLLTIIWRGKITRNREYVCNCSGSKKFILSSKLLTPTECTAPIGKHLPNNAREFHVDTSKTFAHLFHCLYCYWHQLNISFRHFNLLVSWITVLNFPIQTFSLMK